MGGQGTSDHATTLDAGGAMGEQQGASDHAMALKSYIHAQVTIALDATQILGATGKPSVVVPLQLGGSLDLANTHKIRDAVENPMAAGNNKGYTSMTVPHVNMDYVVVHWTRSDMSHLLGVADGV